MAAMFPRFVRIDTVYKTLHGTPFTTAILVPNALTLTFKPMQTTCPLLVHFHGGGLYMGTNLDPRFTAQWFCLHPELLALCMPSQPETNAPRRPLKLTEAKSAIIVSPTYRLMPEATGLDMLDDLKDFWEWVHKSLPKYVANKWPHLTLDVDRTAVTGESAGGYLALQSAFLFSWAHIKVAMAQYCAIYQDIPAWNAWNRRSSTEDQVAADALVKEYISQIKPGAIRLSSPYPAMLELGDAIRQTGRRWEFFGDDERLKLGYGLRTAEKIPPIWIIQGTEDRIVSLTLCGEEN
jgi:hypothetical protein